MFGFKKNEPQESWADRQYEPLWNEVLAARRRLSECVDNVIIKSGVVDLYPEGEDKEVAKKAVEATKFLLLCAINRFNDKLNQLQNFYDKHKSDLVVLAHWDAYNWKDSHTYIEYEYEYLLKKGG